MIKPFLLYGSEKWKWTSCKQQGSDRTYTNLLRHVLNMYWSEHALREQIYGKLPPLPQKLTKCRLQFSAQTSTALQRKSQKRISRQALVCLPFIGGNIFSPTADKPNVFRFRFKSAEWAGNFVVRSQEVILRIISFTRPFGLLVWNFGRPRANRKRLWRGPGSLADQNAWSKIISQSIRTNRVKWWWRWRLWEPIYSDFVLENGAFHLSLWRCFKTLCRFF